ncbi:hypothetical protein FJTKL_07999 [Diaporthe vaccinii]|uniref:Peptidase S8/S53 domain-containing protein n=1 Tax=Diaporthe vaccinii TaxID=105482 RepID=A0ABR4FEQ3_9PEZI
MFGLPILLGLCIYILLSSALPLIDSPLHLNGSFGTNNISNFRTVVVDPAANDYLTLLSAAFDVNDPNPVERGYHYDISSGQGTTIFVVDSGFSLDRYPDEQCLDQRRIDTHLLPRVLRGLPLADAEKNAGYYNPPDNMDDVGAPSKSGNFRGHGTQVAILAAGCKTGVARNANLYLIKFIEVKMKSGIVVETQSSPAAQIQGLRQIISVVQGSVAGVSVPRGKAVLVLSAGRWKEDDMKRAHGNNWEVTKSLMMTALEQLDQLGVTVVLAAGNDGASSNPQQNPNFAPLYIDQHFPLALATANSPILAVGSTNNKGQLSVFSTPGRGYTPVSLYAQGEGVSTYDLLESRPTLKSGTSYAAPIVAGLAAYTLGLDSNPCPYNPTPVVGEDSVGMCIKKYLTRTAFQRIDSNNMLAQDPSQYKYDIPPNILVASNGASVGAEEQDGDNPDADPTACWSDDTRGQCKLANITGTGFEE